jgi:hypothetical protein
VNNLGARVLEDAHELFGIQRVVVEDQVLLAVKETVDLIGQVARDLCHEVAIRVRGDASDLGHARGVVDHEEHVVRHEPALRPHVDSEEVGGNDDVSVRFEERLPRGRPVWTRCNAVVLERVGDGGASHFVSQLLQFTLDSQVAPA